MRNEIANFKDCKSIAIMGGTFDPIHNGHLVTAEAVRHRFKVDRVVFIPTGRPAHKANKKVTHNEHRYLMTVLATMRNENFEVSRIEIDRPGATYTIDTIEELKKICRPDVRLYFITGADAINQIMSWKQPERLLTLCDFVAVTRPGYDKARLFEKLNRRYVEMTYEEISAETKRNINFPLVERMVEEVGLTYPVGQDTTLRYSGVEANVRLQYRTTNQPVSAFPISSNSYSRTTIKAILSK